MMYADYDYYVDQFCGTIIPYEQFKNSERKAEAYIKKLTCIKGDIFADANDIVKDAVCAVSEVYYSCEEGQRERTIKSENNDGYSVTYVVEQTDGQTLEEMIRKKAYEAAAIYLLPTGWLSRKVGCCCDNKCNDNCL